MRPRHKAAENEETRMYVELRKALASMRPRHKAAENEATARRACEDYAASMRPRHKAAENRTEALDRTTRSARFNEAAA